MRKNLSSLVTVGMLHLNVLLCARAIARGIRAGRGFVKYIYVYIKLIKYIYIYIVPPSNSSRSSTFHVFLGGERRSCMSWIMDGFLFDASLEIDQVPGTRFKCSSEIS